MSFIGHDPESRIRISSSTPDFALRIIPSGLFHVHFSLASLCYPAKACLLSNDHSYRDTTRTVWWEHTYVQKI